MRPILQMAAVAVIMLGVPLLAVSAPTAAHQPSKPVPVPPELFHQVPLPDPVEPPHVSSGETAIESPHPTVRPDVILDSIERTPEPTRPAVEQPSPRSVVVVVEPKPHPNEGQVIVGKGHSISGKASWYCWPSYPSACARGFPYGGRYAAAGPKLRAAICGVQSCTSWRGRTVMVNGIPVKLIDWCQCHYRTNIEKIIDLYHNVWEETHARGGVTITW